MWWVFACSWSVCGWIWSLWCNYVYIIGWFLLFIEMLRKKAAVFFGCGVVRIIDADAADDLVHVVHHCIQLFKLVYLVDVKTLSSLIWCDYSPWVCTLFNDFKLCCWKFNILSWFCMYSVIFCVITPSHCRDAWQPLKWLFIHVPHFMNIYITLFTWNVLIGIIIKTFIIWAHMILWFTVAQLDGPPI